MFSVLKNAFDAFDHEKKGVISTEMIGTILEMLGHELDEDTLKEIIAEVDINGILSYNLLKRILDGANLSITFLQIEFWSSMQAT